MKTIHSILIFLTLLLAHSLPGQEEAPTVQISFQAFLWPSHAPLAANSSQDGPSNQTQANSTYIPPEVAYLESGKGSERSFQLLDDRRTDVMNYRGPEALTFYKAGTAMAAPGARVELGRLKIPPKAKELTIFFFPLPSGGYKIFSIETSPATIPQGSTLVYNLSTTRLACKLDETNFTIDPGQSAVKAFSLPDKHYQPILVASLSREGKWKRSLARKLIVDQNDRLLLIIYNLEANPDSFNLLRLVFRPDSD
ncbi:hypothetical protein QEH59_04390 [Coraliomargarita sp. SDUM461004]|uniref:DUF4397 domain-containing protein n=1 Tax=Thalassobacterium sedimentorum TaxID=3041258 RepID=A0ABU1AFV4_9BACT|nr:hypothetical protein [Coraliomargarita sp. SDUM461004]MDQ8193648.1 hypothetical protein [Coraliomargarita sp. SDUM461004]